MSSITGVSTVDTVGDGPAGDGGADRASTGRLGDRIFGGAATGAGIFVIVLVALVAAFLVSQAVPSLAKDHVNFLTSRVWDVDGSVLRFGIADLLWVTVISSVVAMVIAVPLGVGVALFLTQYAPKRLATPMGYLIDLLAAVPSIVYGLWAARIFGQHLDGVQSFLSDALGWIPLFDKTSITQSSTIFVAAVVLAIMVLPIVTALSRDVFDQTPATHKEGALALGATKWEMIRTSVLPFGRPGVISAAMLGLGRALGETIAVSIILSVVAPGSPFSWSLFNGGETFAAKIANNAQEFDNPSKAGAFIAAGLVLFVLTFVVNAIARIVIERRKAFSE